jgi:hypothetical protein
MRAHAGVLPESNALVVIDNVVRHDNVIGGAVLIAGTIASAHQNSYVIVKHSVVADCVVGSSVPSCDTLRCIVVTDVVYRPVVRRSQVNALVLIATAGTACPNIVHYISNDLHGATRIVTLFDAAGAITGASLLTRNIVDVIANDTHVIANDTHVIACHPNTHVGVTGHIESDQIDVVASN